MTSRPHFFLRPLAAEVALGWRRAVRGPLLTALGLVLLLLFFCAPTQGETAAAWTACSLGFAWGILLISGLWSGGLAYAADRDRHRLALFFTKPASPWLLWWGRFLGTLAPFSVAIFLLWILLLFRNLPPGRFCLPPDLPDLELATQQEMNHLRKTERLPKNVSERRLARAVRTELRNRYTELRPEEPRTYTFSIPNGRPPSSLDFRLSGTPFMGAKEALSLDISLFADGKIERFRPDALFDTGFSLPLPKQIAHPSQPLHLTLTRRDTHDAASILYREREDLALLLPGYSAILNQTYLCLLLLATVAMMVALGAAFGCALSLPVTLFSGSAILLAFTAAALAPTTSVADEQATRWGRFSAPVAYTVAQPFRALVTLNPIQRVIDGEAILTQEINRFLLFSMLPWLLCCSLAAPLTATRDETL